MNIERQTLDNLNKEVEKHAKKQIASVVARKKTAKAEAHIFAGSGKITVNRRPLDLFGVSTLKAKLYEPINILSTDVFKDFDINVIVRGGGAVSQMYAVRMGIARALVAYYRKYVDESQALEIKNTLMNYDRHLLVIDTRKSLPKKFGGRGARHRFRKSFR